jgi:hypothetical protein
MIYTELMSVVDIDTESSHSQDAQGHGTGDVNVMQKIYSADNFVADPV